MCQEDDGNEAPDQISTIIPMQGRNVFQVQRIIVNMGSYVAFVLSQVELDAWYYGRHIVTIGCQGIKGIHQTGRGVQIGLLQEQNVRAAFSQHLPDTLLQLSFSLPGFEHLGTKVVPVEHQSVKQKP